MVTIVDNRAIDRGKSIPNRQRFFERARESVRDAVKRNLGSTGPLDQSGQKIRIGSGSVSEPEIRRSREGGDRDYVLPGNKTYRKGDEIPRPSGGSGGGGSGTGTGGSQGAVDEFEFILNREEFESIIFEDCELPNLDRLQVGETTELTRRRAGFMRYGSPSQLDLKKTVLQGLARKTALGRPTLEDRDRLEAKIEALISFDPRGELERTRQELRELDERRGSIPYMDDVDLRYRRFEQIPLPVTRAVMFCLMDVSGSVTEHMKNLAKRFYYLLSVFLRRKYQLVEIVFVRHTDTAKEVDEETFFYDRESGGTLVSAGLAETLKIVRERYATQWNIYVAQSSDGDRDGAEEPAILNVMQELVPLCQYFAYLEVADEDKDKKARSRLWQTYKRIKTPLFAMQSAKSESDILPVFREFFKRQQA